MVEGVAKFAICWYGYGWPVLTVYSKRGVTSLYRSEFVVEIVIANEFCIFIFKIGILNTIDFLLDLFVIISHVYWLGSWHSVLKYLATVQRFRVYDFFCLILDFVFWTRIYVSEKSTFYYFFRRFKAFSVSQRTVKNETDNVY